MMRTVEDITRQFQVSNLSSLPRGHMITSPQLLQENERLVDELQADVQAKEDLIAAKDDQIAVKNDLKGREIATINQVRMNSVMTT